MLARPFALLVRLLAVLPMVGLLGGGLGGCVGTTPTPGSAMTITAGEYAQYFDASREALRRFSFEVDRVDASRGLITTRPTSSAGLATLWTPHHDSFRANVEGLLHRDRRSARISFAATELGLPDPGVIYTGPDLRSLDPATPVTLAVEVLIERTYEPGRRLDPTAIRFMSFTDSWVGAGGGGGAGQTQVHQIGQDRELAERIADAIRARAPRFLPQN